MSTHESYDAAFVFTATPFADLTCQEGLDAAFAFAAFDQQVGLFFLADSSWALAPDVQPKQTGNRDFLRQLGALEIYDIHQVFASRRALEVRGLSPDRLQIRVEALSDQQIAAKLQQYRQVFRF